jgi:hypothetical protein
MKSHNRAGLAAAVATALLAGCASAPPPTDKLALAESAIQRAERSGAQQAAPGELGAAREKLARAQSAADRDAETAARLAEQAELDATLAESRAEAQRARNALTSVEQSLDALRDEAARSGRGGAAPSPTDPGTALPSSAPPSTTAPPIAAPSTPPGASPLPQSRP